MILRSTQKLGEVCTLTYQDDGVVKSIQAIRLCIHYGKYATLPASLQSVPNGFIAYISNDGKIKCVNEDTWERGAWVEL